jgi:hypothetical protein
VDEERGSIVSEAFRVENDVPMVVNSIFVGSKMSGVEYTPDGVFIWENGQPYTLQYARDQEYTEKMLKGQAFGL